MSEEQQKMSFLNKLDYLLNKHNKTKKELCDATGISRSTVDNWYARKQEEIKRSQLVAIADFFHVSLYYLCVDDWFEEKQDPNASPFNDLLDNGDVLAFHLDGIKDASDFTDDEIKEIRNFIEFVKSKKQ